MLDFDPGKGVRTLYTDIRYERPPKNYFYSEYISQPLLFTWVKKLNQCFNFYQVVSVLLLKYSVRTFATSADQLCVVVPFCGRQMSNKPLFLLNRVSTEQHVVSSALYSDSYVLSSCLQPAHNVSIGIPAL